MVETSMDAPIADSPMGDSDESGVTALQVSVSFGRFKNDMLAWEKWSTFPTNKYLEEVEKCSTPGSVAQKKAYFEAHYKKIAARKAEQEEQARDPVDSVVQAQRDFALDAEKVKDWNSENEVTNSASETRSDQADEMEVTLAMTNESNDSMPLIDVGKLNSRECVSGIELGNESGDKSKDCMLSTDAKKLNDQNSVSGIELENEVENSASEIYSDQVDETKDSLELVNESKDLTIALIDEAKDKSRSHEPEDSFIMVNESKDLIALIDEVKDEYCCRLVGLESHELKDSLIIVNENKDSIPIVDEVKYELEEVALAKDKAPSQGSERVEELPHRITNARDNTSIDKEEKVKSEKSLKTQKATTTKKATNTTAVKKKPAAPAPKSSLLSTPKLSRPALTKSTMSETRASSKKEHATSPLINRKPARSEIRRATPTSLHMSLSLSTDRPANSEPPPSKTVRKSAFMEKMGDKDIVKRVFKAFRNELNQLSSSTQGKPTLASQVPGKETGMKASVVGTPQKKIEGVDNLVKKTPQSSQPGLRKTSNPTRSSHTAVGADQRNVRSVSSNYGLRSHDKPDKRKEFSKKLEEKANGKETERTQLQSKVKKEAEIKKLSHDHSTKAKPIVGTAKPKSPLDKKSVK